MLSLLAVLTLARSQVNVLLQPSDGVWVYSHAGDPSGDEFLRVWGAGGMATPEGKGAGDDWSYGYLRFDVSTARAEPPKSALLTVYNVNPPGFGDLAGAKAAPLEVRALVGSFDGKSWEYSMAIKVHPDLANTVFGIGVPKAWGESKEPIPITMDLRKGPGDFSKYLIAAKASETHSLFLALTSAISPSTDDGGGAKGGVFKVFSAAAKDVKLRPMLTLVY